MVIERNAHVCGEVFVQKFKALFNQKNSFLLGGNEVFKFQINDELQVLKMLGQYQQQITDFKITPTPDGQPEEEMTFDEIPTTIEKPGLPDEGSLQFFDDLRASHHEFFGTKEEEKKEGTVSFIRRK